MTFHYQPIPICECFLDMALPDEYDRVDSTAQTDLESKWSFANRWDDSSSSAGAEGFIPAPFLLLLLARTLAEEQMLKYD